MVQLSKDALKERNEQLLELYDSLPKSVKPDGRQWLLRSGAIEFERLYRKFGMNKSAAKEALTRFRRKTQ